MINSRKSIIPFLLLSLVILLTLTYGCTTSNSPTSPVTGQGEQASQSGTQSQPISPQQPTPTPACTFKCDIDTQQYGFEITCESGSVSTTFNNESTHYNYDTSGQMSGTTLDINRDFLFQTNQHKDHIEGTITIDQLTNTVSYEITASGDSFGDSPQTCKNGTGENSQPVENLPTPTLNPAFSSLPAGLLEAVALCGGHPPCALLSVEKVKTLTDFDKQYVKPVDGELYCLVVSLSDINRTPYGYYDGTNWTVMFDWTEKDFIDHGCTNYPK
jgi:hypothetical protein